MSNAFIEKLRGFAPLSDEDIALLAEASSIARTVPPRTDLAREGEPPGPVFVILAGWACRYKILPEGTRQITAFLMPGDFCDMHASVLNVMDHSIATLNTATIAAIPRREFEILVETRPVIMRAFWWTQLVDEAVLRAWIVSMGRRDSLQRVAHLLCELYVCGRNIGMVSGDHFELPLTQIVLGDALGLTPVHVNRVLARLRANGVVERRGGALVIGQIGRLAEIAGFDDNYLHRRIQCAA